MKTVWSIWVGVGVAIELHTLTSNRHTLSQTIRSVVDTPLRKGVWAVFCLWLIGHIDG